MPVYPVYYPISPLCQLNDFVQVVKLFYTNGANMSTFVPPRGVCGGGGLITGKIAIEGLWICDGAP